jgi:hypothetical protein
VYRLVLACLISLLGFESVGFLSFRLKRTSEPNGARTTLFSLSFFLLCFVVRLGVSALCGTWASSEAKASRND